MAVLWRFYRRSAQAERTFRTRVGLRSVDKGALLLLDWQGLLPHEMGDIERGDGLTGGNPAMMLRDHDLVDLLQPANQTFVKIDGQSFNPPAPYAQHSAVQPSSLDLHIGNIYLP